MLEMEQNKLICQEWRRRRTKSLAALASGCQDIRSSYENRKCHDWSKNC